MFHMIRTLGRGLTLAACLSLLVACGGGGGGSGSATPNAIAGTISFERPSVSSTVGLDYGNPIVRPVRGATVRLIDAGNASVIASTSLASDGSYSFGAVGASSVRLLIASEAMSPAIRVEDNTAANVVFEVETPDQAISGPTTFDFTIPMGWTGVTYDAATRLSGPFNLLDLAYEATTDFLAVRPAALFPPCVLNWSPSNVGVAGEVALGQIGMTRFDAGSNELFILGAEGANTDEFDGHVVIGEWAHWFEANMARSDSIGGPHAPGARLDMRVAFSEGFGAALSGMILAPNSIYVDTAGTLQATVLTMVDLEGNGASNPGWFSEASVRSLLFDLFDGGVDGVDSIELGLGPIYDAMVDGQKNTEFLTSIFTFIDYVKSNAGLVPGDMAVLDSLCVAQFISPVADGRGSTETNDGGDPANLPVYDQVAVSAVTNTGPNREMSPAAGAGNANKLGSHRYAYVVASGLALQLRYGANSDVEAYAFKRGVQLGFADAVPGFGLEFIDLATTVNGDTYVAVFSDATLAGAAYLVQLATNP